MYQTYTIYLIYKICKISGFPKYITSHKIQFFYTNNIFHSSTFTVLLNCFPSLCNTSRHVGIRFQVYFNQIVIRVPCTCYSVACLPAICLTIVCWVLQKQYSVMSIGEYTWRTSTVDCSRPQQNKGNWPSRLVRPSCINYQSI